MSHEPSSGGLGTLQPHNPGGLAGSAPSGMLGEREVVRNTGKQAIISFLGSQTCYSVLRASGKVVVFDTRIPIQLAFYALVEHGKYTSWHTESRQTTSIDLALNRYAGGTPVGS